MFRRLPRVGARLRATSMLDGLVSKVEGWELGGPWKFLKGAL